MNLELNKTYQTKNNYLVKIINVDYSYTMPFFGHVVDSAGNIIRPASFNSAGMMYNHKESDFDITNEVK